MNKILQFPVVRIIIASLFVGTATAVGQILLGLLRAAFSITNPAIANALAFILIIPLTYFAYRAPCSPGSKSEMATELGFSKPGRNSGSAP